MSEGQGARKKTLATFEWMCLVVDKSSSSSVADRVCRTSELWHTLHKGRHKERKDASETISGAIDSGRAQGTGSAGEHGNRVGATLKTGSHPADGR